MVKAKFRDDVRSRNETGMKNEVRFKFLCRNIVVIHRAIIEMGIEATFWPEKPNPKGILKFGCRDQNETVGISG